MNLASFKHFAIGVVALVAPAIPTVLVSPVVLHFVENHTVLAIYFPVLSGLVVELVHRYWPTSPKPAA